MGSWVYDDGYDLDVNELDSRGEDGWELVTVYPTRHGNRFVFKAPVSDDVELHEGSEP